MKKADIKMYKEMEINELKERYLQRVKAYKNAIRFIKANATKILELDSTTKNYEYSIKSIAEESARYSKDLKEYREHIDTMESIIEEREAQEKSIDELNEYIVQNDINISKIIEKIEELKEFNRNNFDELYKEYKGIITIKDVFETIDNAYKNLLNIIKDSIGNIENCNIWLNPKNGLDGKIYGENGKIEIQTIFAGGYNIQKLHYRTLIKRF